MHSQLLGGALSRLEPESVEACLELVASEFLELISSRMAINLAGEDADVRSPLQIALILRSLSPSSGSRRGKASQ